VNPPLKLTITVTRTADGKQDYVQVMSADQMTTNIVLIADEIVVADHRALKPHANVTRARKETP